MTDPVIIQAIGIAALLIAISIYQTNTRKTMLLLGMISCMLWVLHFSFLGAMTGAAMNLIGVGRSYIFFKIKPDKNNRWILWAFIGFIILFTIITWHGTLSLLPLVGSVINVVAYWQKKPKYIRRLAFMTSPPWFTYNAIVGSYPGMVVEILLMTSNLIGQYRFDFRTLTKRKLSRATKTT